MITAAQLRAARGLLDWTRNDLAQAAAVSPETIKNIEHGTFRPQETTADAIVRAFAVHGVEFTDDNGVRFFRDSVRRLEGNQGFKIFIDDVYETVKVLSSQGITDKPTCISYVDDRFFIKHLGDYLNPHIERMNQIKNFKTQILIEDKPYSYLESERENSSYREYRKNVSGQAGNVPFYVYGDKFAILIFDETKPPQFVVIASELVAKAYREQFKIMWDTAKPFTKL